MFFHSNKKIKMSFLFPVFKKITSIFFSKGFGSIPGVRFLYKILYKKFKLSGICLFENVQGYKMWINTDDTGIAPYIMMRGIFGEYETGVIKKIIKPGMTAVDIGANFGYFSLLLSGLVGESGKVFAFEPDSTAFKLLSRNIKENGIKNVFLINKALSNKAGRTKLYLDKDNKGEMSLSLANVDKPCGCISVETITLDSYFANLNEKIDFIKMDVQGAEGMVIAGACEILNKHNPKILFEFWPWGLNNLGFNPEKLLADLIIGGYKIKEVKEVLNEYGVSNISKTSSNRKDNKGFTNLLCES